jgi:DNA-binding transcriptional LysR family regulator
MLQAGVIHLYIGVAGQTERALETQPLFRDRMRVVVREGHPLGSQPMTPRSYAEAPHLLVSPRREGESIVGRALEAAGYARRVAVEVPYFSLVPGLLAVSDLVATVPERVAELFADLHPVEILEPPLELPDIEICMAWHPTFAADPAQIWLRDVVASVCREL